MKSGALIERVKRLTLLPHPLDMGAEVDERNAVLDDFANFVVNRADANSHEDGTAIASAAFNFDRLGFFVVKLGLEAGNRIRIRHSGHEELNGLTDDFPAGKARQEKGSCHWRR